MHLLQDMAVPAHVRNDFLSHLEVNNYSLDESMQNWFNNAYELYVKNHPSLVDNADASVINSVKATFANPRLTDFWDTNQYNGGSTTAILGLAEFTNMNYLSDNTIPSDLQMSYPYPPKADIFYYRLCSDLIPASEGTALSILKKRKYISRLSSGECPEITAARTTDHFAAVPLWSAISGAMDISSNPYITKLQFYLDDNVHNTYAKELLPRAVGYSAGLLNYFFRGTLEITPPAQNVYAITDGSQTPYTDKYGHQHQEFTKIKAKVRNTTPNETAGAGTLQAVAMYKMRIDYQPDLSGDPTDEHPEWGVSEDDFSYSVSAPITIASLDSSQSVEFTFDFAASPIPAGVTDLYLQVVFKGALGNEAANAIAVGMKDLAEPAHHVFWNLSDQFSLGSEVTSTMVYYHLYTEDVISTTATLRNMVDLKPTGQPNGVLNEQGEPYIRPFPMTFEIAYINETNQTTTPLPVARVGNLPAGQYIRLVMIQDREQPRIVRFSYSDQIDPGIIGISDQQYPEVINQTEPDGYYYYMPVETFRHGSSDDPIRHHFYTGILRCYPMLSGDYCPYNETESIPVDLNPYPSEILFDN